MELTTFLSFPISKLLQKCSIKGGGGGGEGSIGL